MQLKKCCCAEVKDALKSQHSKCNKTKISHMVEGDHINARFEINTLSITKKYRVCSNIFDKINHDHKKRKTVSTVTDTNTRPMKQQRNSIYEEQVITKPQLGCGKQLRHLKQLRDSKQILFESISDNISQSSSKAYNDLCLRGRKKKQGRYHVR